LAQIQRLIEADITQVPLPEDLGAGPEFSIQSKPKSKPFHKKKKPFRPKPSSN
jgi:hypothetical protein